MHDYARQHSTLKPLNNHTVFHVMYQKFLGGDTEWDTLSVQSLDVVSSFGHPVAG